MINGVDEEGGWGLFHIVLFLILKLKKKIQLDFYYFYIIINYSVNKAYNQLYYLSKDYCTDLWSSQN